jgi:hypothetical protein
MGENSPKIDTIGNYYPQFGKADYGNTMAKLAQNLSAQIVCPSPKVWDFDEERFHWASLVRVLKSIPINIYAWIYLFENDLI